MAVLFENYNTGDNAGLNCGAFPVNGPGLWGGQTFTPIISHGITSVKLKLRKSLEASTPGTVTVSIKATDGDGIPTGADLCSGNTDGNTLTNADAGEWREITFGAGYNLVADTKYAIATRSPTNVDPVVWRDRATSPTYSRGSSFTTAVGGAWLEDLTVDMMFEEWGTVTNPTFLNGTGTATGSPVTLVEGSNTITITGAGTFEVILPGGVSGTASSGTATLTGSPVALVEGSNTITVTDTGTIIITIVLPVTVVARSSIRGSAERRSLVSRFM